MSRSYERRNRDLDSAQAAFTRAAAALADGCRDTSSLSTALVEGGLAMLKVAQADYSDDAKDEAEHTLRVIMGDKP